MSKVPQKFKIQSCSNGQDGRFWDFKMTKIDFTLILSDWKSLHFHIVYSQLGCPSLYNFANHFLFHLFGQLQGNLYLFEMKWTI